MIVLYRHSDKSPSTMIAFPRRALAEQMAQALRGKSFLVASGALPWPSWGAAALGRRRRTLRFTGCTRRPPCTVSWTSTGPKQQHLRRSSIDCLMRHEAWDY